MSPLTNTAAGDVDLTKTKDVLSRPLPKSPGVGGGLLPHALLFMTSTASLLT